MESSYCDHRVSNKEIDYVIERIMNRTYLFEPPHGIRNGRKFYNPYISLYDVAKQERISHSAQSQSPERTFVPCQRCGHGNHYVYLYRIYKRMVQRGLIEDYPEVEEVSNGRSFSKCYLKINSSN